MKHAIKFQWEGDDPDEAVYIDVAPEEQEEWIFRVSRIIEHLDGALTPVMESVVIASKDDFLLDLPSLMYGAPDKDTELTVWDMAQREFGPDFNHLEAALRRAVPLAGHTRTMGDGSEQEG